MLDCGGIDNYTNAVFDIYQDNFKEGIFTGKGIYDLETFSKVLKNAIPENTVLSHDLLEGNYLRCGLASDILLLDGYPEKFNSFITRLHRWIRGDWQISIWLSKEVLNANGKKIKNPLNTLSKFKILDNLRRSLVKIFSFFLLVISFLFFETNKSLGVIALSGSLVSISIMYLLDIINYIVFKESNINGAIYSHKKFSKDLLGIKLDFLKIFLEIIFLPYEMYRNLDSIIRSIYRMNKKKKLLEWVTAEDGEKQVKNNLFFIYKKMIINIFVGFFFVFFSKNLLFKIIGFLFVIAPCVAFEISKENNKKNKINPNDKKYIKNIGFKTWKFFEDFIIEKNNYLICDNYQDNRYPKIVSRTSSTNIGLELISVISSYDLGFISLEKTIEYLKNIINTVKVLPKWNGHLYNWYNIDNLEPLKPRYISTVDSGNFVRIFIYC